MARSELASPQNDAVGDGGRRLDLKEESIEVSAELAHHDLVDERVLGGESPVERDAGQTRPRATSFIDERWMPNRQNCS